MQQSVASEKPADGDLVAQITSSAEDLAQAKEIGDQLLAQFPTDESVKQYVTNTRQAFDAMDNSKMLQMAEEAAAAAQIKIDGDTATLTFKDHEPNVVNLKKIDGKWRLLPESVGAPFAPENDEMRQEMAQSAKISLAMKSAMHEGYAAYLKDLSAKKFTTAKEAMDAIQKMQQTVMMKVMTEQAPPH